MKTRNLMGLALAFLFMSGTVLNAQVDQTGKDKQSQTGKGMGMSSSSSMRQCMDQIAADTTMRMEMFSKLMDNMKGDTSAMRQMCSKMMSNPEMHGMMMRMMNKEGSGGMGGGMMKGDMKHEMGKMGDTSSIKKPQMP